MTRVTGAMLLAAAVALPGAASGQERTAFALTIPSIMRGAEVVGREPSNIRWSPDGQWIHFEWLPPGTSWKESLRPYRVRARPGAVPEALSDAAADSLAPLVADGPVSRDRRRKVVAADGDLYLVTLPAGAVTRLTRTAAAEQALGFDAAGARVFFRRDGNVLALDLASGAVDQLTDLRTGPAPDSARRAAGQKAFLEREDQTLFEVIRDRQRQDSLDKARRQSREMGRAKTVWLQPREQVGQLIPSPDGRWVFLTTSIPGNGAATRIPNYVTLDGYTEDITGRTKVGDTQSRQRVGILDTRTSTVKWLAPVAGDSAQVYGSLFGWGWNDAGTSLLFRTVTREYTRRAIHRLDVDSVRLATIDVLVDTAWIDGPCSTCAGWLPGDAGVWFVSEADGWAHLYTIRADGTGRQQRTRGQWEVLDVDLLPDRTRFALHTSEPSVYERHLYLMPVAGGPAVRVTTAVGGHAARLSPDGRLAADVYSESNRPPELMLVTVAGGAEPARLTTSPTPEWLAFPWIRPEIVEVPASDGIKVPARIYRPADVGAQPNGAAVIFVHGAGYLHNVHRFWSSYYREYMFHHYLARQGYIVLDLDYRGSAGYGRDWRTAIYRHMGGRDLQDQVDGARWLQATYNISPDRIGIYGGSYGGFITLMALFTEGRWFGAGAALRSVTDWAHYNHGYTANILNEPQEDSVAYRQSSPIYFAEGLEDPLLMAHGMVDVNVHFQDIVRLSQRLIELGKTDWELAVYPVEDHGFVRPDSWTDEYRRIDDLFRRYLLSGR